MDKPDRSTNARRSFSFLLLSLCTSLSAPRHQGAQSLAVSHYKRLRIKTVQHETLSHFILNRGSTFSTANNGDLGMIQEALEASQIYQDNGMEVRCSLFFGWCWGCPLEPTEC